MHRDARLRHGHFIAAPPLPDGPSGGFAHRSRYLSRERLERGLVVSLGGVGGWNWLPRLLRRGLDEGGVEAGIVVYNWSVGPLGFWVTDLFARDRNRAVARELAETVAAYRDWMPGRPVTLIGHSGGGAVAVWTLESLPPGVTVDRAVLLAPALAPSYNLGPALAHVRDAAYVASSPLDAALMGLGTTLFGTIERHFSPSMGLLGHRVPADLSAADRSAYAKLHTMRWRPSMIGDGHLGGHLGWSTTCFARRRLAPLVAGETVRATV